MPKNVDFSKVAVFTDIHYGMRNNSRDHNDSCEGFIKWMIEQSEEQGIKTCIFGGDFHHVRAAINISTLNYSVSGLRLLSSYFDNIFFIIGNHDLFYRDKYEIHSLPYVTEFPNITLVDQNLEMDGVAFVPWLVKDDWKKVPEIKSPYMFGHFELPRFKMNAMVEMPDHGEIRVENFSGIESVYSGHFHLRQHKKNINYIGNCFPHNFADAGDDQRGMMIKEWGCEDQYFAWPGQPLYRVMKLSEAIDHGKNVLRPNMHVRVELDIDISYEEANFIKDTFVREHNLREMALIPSKRTDIDIDLAPGEVKFESVDQIVTDQLTNIESEFYDPKLLLKIYQNL